MTIQCSKPIGGGARERLQLDECGLLDVHDQTALRDPKADGVAPKCLSAVRGVHCVWKEACRAVALDAFELEAAKLRELLEAPDLASCLFEVFLECLLELGVLAARASSGNDRVICFSAL